MISVVIPVYNGEKILARCLNALESQTVPRDQYEIIVVNDGSKDGTKKVAEEYNVTLLTQENQGPAAARNYGVKVAKGDVVLFIDSDCAAVPNWIEVMSKPFNDPAIVGVKGTYKTTQKSIIAHFVQTEYEEKYERMKKYAYIDFIDTYSAGFRKDVFLQYGGYDTSFPTATVEDQEFSFRLSKDGHKMLFLPQAIVYHLHQATLRGYMRRKYWIAYWKILVLKHHPEKFINDTHTPQVLKFQILLTYALILSLPGLFFAKLWCIAPLSILATFLLTTTPFVSFAWKRSKSVALVSPALFFIRSICFCTGLITGMFKAIRTRGSFQNSR